MFQRERPLKLLQGRVILALLDQHRRDLPKRLGAAGRESLRLAERGRRRAELVGGDVSPAHLQVRFGVRGVEAGRPLERADSFCRVPLPRLCLPDPKMDGSRFRRLR